MTTLLNHEIISRVKRRFLKPCDWDDSRMEETKQKRKVSAGEWTFFFFLSLTITHLFSWRRRRKQQQEANGTRSGPRKWTDRESAWQMPRPGRVRKQPTRKRRPPPPKKEVVHYAIFTIDFPSSRQKESQQQLATLYGRWYKGQIDRCKKFAFSTCRLAKQQRHFLSTTNQCRKCNKLQTYPLQLSNIFVIFGRFQSDALWRLERL